MQIPPPSSRAPSPRVALDPPGTRPRILFYSHDSYGLGHLRRSLTLAGALKQRLPEAGVVIVTGSACATQFHPPRGIEVIKLPGITKDSSGSYVARDLPTPLPALLRIRRRLLEELARAFRPDLLVVDNKVRGLCGELGAVLDRARPAGTRTLLGLRDIIDEADTVAREWGGEAERRTLAELYDRVCVYGSPTVFDTAREYLDPPELAERAEFTGYVVRPDRTPAFQPLPRLRPNVLVTVGGGEDGRERIQTYIESLESEHVDWDSTIILGPLADHSAVRHIKRRARSLPGVRVHVFYEDLPRLLSEASAVVAMAGYNTVAEIMQSRTPAVFLPRTHPRREQLLRARRLEQLGVATCLPSPTPHELASAVRRALDSRWRPEREIPLDGCTRFCEVALELLETREDLVRQPARR